MKSFGSETISRAIPVSLLWLHGKVMEYRGKQELYEKQRPEVLKTLREIALIQSAESSNRIEGVTVEARRLKPLVLGEVKPRERPEEEIVGYRKALNWIHTKQDRFSIDTDSILNLHKLAQGGTSGDAGKWKTSNNDIIEILPSGERKIRFRPVEVEKTPHMMKQLCLAYEHTMQQGTWPPLLADASLILDFLCIHPFRDGNGRVSRLMTLLCLYKQGFHVGRYISIERIIEETKESYYEALQKSSTSWHEGEHDLVPWWSYFLSTLHSAYREFEERVSSVGKGYGTKGDLIETAIVVLPKEFSFAELSAQCPTTSKERIRQVLRTLRNQGQLEPTTKGRGAKWRKKS